MIMRKNYQMWLLGALFGGLVLPFAGCSNEDDPISNGQGSGEKVKTEFAITFTRGNTTKASTDEVGEGSFQGMTNMRLLGYTNANLGTDNKVTASMTLLDIIGLDPDIPSSATTDDPDGLTGFKTLYSISLLPQPQSFMFYGESLLNYNSGGVGKLTAHYPQTSETANSTTFTLEGLTAEEGQDMLNYLTGVVQAAVGSVSLDNQTQLESFFSLCTSPAIHQVAEMLDQLYFNTTLWGTGTVSTTVQDAIKVENPIFNDLSSVTLSAEGDLYNQIKTDVNVDYLGSLYPKGGKTLKITCNFAASTNSTVAFEDNANTFYRPTSLYYMANSYLVAYNNYDNLSWATTGTVQEGGLDLTTPVTPSSSTSKVALHDQVQYAVGQLSVELIINGPLSGNETTDANIDPSSIELKGIIIGKQYQAGWDFLPTTETKANFAAYDNVGASNNQMRMLALPTKANDPVTIALELVNNSDKSFEGVNNGEVPAGATFYVTAELDPDNQMIDGKQAAVFMSDYVTTAKLRLLSLENSYNTVPDLDNANLEFALGVDLDWKTGLSFDVEIP